MNSFFSEVDDILEERRKYHLDFKNAIDEIWGIPLTHIEALIDKSYRYCVEIIKNLKIEESFDFAIATIVGKAFLKFEEIVVLLRNGYPDGAMAISRSLHELTIHMLFLITYKDNEMLIRRYFDYSEIIIYKELRALKKVNEEMGEIFERKDEFEAIKKRRSILINKYGESFGRDHGWAFCIDGVSNFHDMEKKVGGGAFATFYQMGCNAIHSNSQTNHYSLGSAEEFGVILSGSSLKGLEFPARFALTSLSAIISGLTVCYKHEKSGLNEIIIQVLNEINQIAENNNKGTL